MAENYDDILNRSWDEIPQPKDLPDGSWLLKCRNVAYLPPKGDTNARVLVFYSPKEPMDDVDADALEALGPDYDFSANQIVATFWIESGRDWDSVRKHFAKHGVDTKGKSQVETFKAMRGTEVVAYLKQATYTDGAGETKIESRPTQFAKVE